MKQILNTGLGLILALIGSTALFAQTYLTAQYSADQETGTVSQTAVGTAALKLTGTSLEYTITIDNLSGPITGAHFHNGALGVDGGVVHNITSGFNNRATKGVWTVPESLIDDLLLGNIYLNIHTAAFPAGETRGQVILTSGTAFTADLTPDQETGTVTSTGSGTAVLTLTDAGLVYKITVDGLTGQVSGAHFHLGEMGANGGVEHNITTAFQGNTASGIWTISESRKNDLLLGRLYLNIHTASFPAGEIRGQVELASGWAFRASLDPQQENPAVTSNGRGTATLTYTPHGLVYRIAVDNLSGPITAAHFHSAPAGTNGGVVTNILASFTGNVATGVWAIPNSDVLEDLLTNQLYINIHTAANPGGEIRGQVLASDAAAFQAWLTPEQEQNNVTSNAKGVAWLWLKDGQLSYQLTATSMATGIQGAHIHQGAIGVNGGVIFGLTANFNGTTANGTLTLTEAQQRDLMTGKYYINLHSTTFPGGEIRGQIQRASGTVLQSTITAAQEPGTVASTATGTGYAHLTSEGLSYSITHTGLTANRSAAHLHAAPLGVDGSVVLNIGTDFTMNTASGAWFSPNARALTGGRLYVNIHTANYPSGEIRGQLLLTEGIGFIASLDGTQEVPAVTTDAHGVSSATLTNAGLVWTLTHTNMSSAPSAGHFHNAPVGVAGGVLTNLTSDLSMTSGYGLWTIPAAQIPLLVSEKVYLNLHTALNPSGEIRGQLTRNTSVSTSIENEDADRVTTLGLKQNYPNPFNPTTAISYDIPQSGQIRLAVYDVLGREVAVLVNGVQQAGSYSLTFDASALSSGVYVYRITSGSKSYAKTMLLVK